MVEKTIDLKDIELVQFLGVKNKNIQGIEEAFPKTKIISRGNKISIKGNKGQLLKVEKVISSLISHFEKYGSVNMKVVASHIRDGYSNEDNEPIVYGSSGKRIIAKTKNQKQKRKRRWCLSEDSFFQKCCLRGVRGVRNGLGEGREVCLGAPVHDFYGLSHGSAAPKNVRGARGVLGEIREVCDRCSRPRFSIIIHVESPSHSVPLSDEDPLPYGQLRPLRWVLVCLREG